MKHAKNSIATVVGRLLKFAERPQWTEALNEYWAAYHTLAAGFLEREPEDVENELEELGLQSMAFGMVFESFATQHDETGHSFLADYLKRAGWRESAPARQYIRALNDSHLSLYEVLDVQRNKGLMLRDLLDPEAKPCFVDERRATHHLARWNIVAARVLPVLKRHQLSAGLLPISREIYARLLQPEWESVRDDSEARAEFLRSLPVLSTCLWMLDAIERAEAPLPELRNHDGEPLLSGTARLPLLAPPETVAAALDAADDWDRAADDPPFWNWLGGPPGMPADTSPDEGSGTLIQSYTDTGEPVRGNAELRVEHLIFNTLSAPRMERGLARLRELLGTALGEALIEYENPWDAVERERAEPATESPEADSIPPEIASQLIQEALDRHYRAVIDQPIPMLDGLTPRQAAADPRARERALEWLKALESKEDQRSAHDGQAPYDTRWLWAELGLDPND